MYDLDGSEHGWSSSKMLAYTAHVRYYLLPPTCIHFCGASETAAAERQTLCERLRQTSKWGPPSKRRKDALNLLLQGCALSCEKIHKAKRRSQRMQPAIKRRWHDSWDSRRIMERHKVEARPNINSQTILFEEDRLHTAYRSRLLVESTTHAVFVLSTGEQTNTSYLTLFNETHWKHIHHIDFHFSLNTTH
jgi:hypothetical protein